MRGEGGRWVGGWGGEGGGIGGLQATGCVMCCQNIWVTKSCPATQTIEAKTGSPGKVGSNILPATLSKFAPTLLRK